MFEGIYGPKEAAQQNIIEDIVEDLNKARDESKNQLDFAKILIDKVFGLEPKNLKATLGERMLMEQCDQEEKNSIKEFIDKIKPVFFQDYSQQIEIDKDSKTNEDMNGQENQTKIHDLAR